jgi:hypothetical protein
MIKLLTGNTLRCQSCRRIAKRQFSDTMIHVTNSLKFVAISARGAPTPASDGPPEDILWGFSVTRQNCAAIPANTMNRRI